LLFKQSAQQSALFHQEHQQVGQARREAEALFRSKPKIVEPSRRSDGSPTEAAARKPRILRAVPPAPGLKKGAAAVLQEQQPALTPLQRARAERHRLNRVDETVYTQQQELQAKLEAIDTELRAIAAYEAAKQGEVSSSPPRHCGV